MTSFLYSAGPAAAGTSGVPAVVNPTAAAPRVRRLHDPAPGLDGRDEDELAAAAAHRAEQLLERPDRHDAVALGDDGERVRQCLVRAAEQKRREVGDPAREPAGLRVELRARPDEREVGGARVRHRGGVDGRGRSTTCGSTLTVRPASPPAWLTVNAHASTPRATAGLSVITPTRIVVAVSPGWPLGVVVGGVGPVVGVMTTLGFGTLTVDGGTIGVEEVVVLDATGGAVVVLDVVGILTALFPPPPLLSPMPTPIAARSATPRTPATISDLRSTKPPSVRWSF